MKIKQILLIVVLIILISACSTSGRFGVSQKYNLDKNEREIQLNNLIIQNYETLINIDTLNFPLNKYILSKKYNVYIGVSFYSKAKEIPAIYQNDSSYLFYINNIEENNASILFKKENTFCYSYIFDDKSDKLTYFLTLTADSATVNSKFSESFLKEKLNIKK